jgi:hypothetical protein
MEKEMKRWMMFLAVAGWLTPLGADELKPLDNYIATDHAPRAVRLSDTGLKEAGLTAGEFFPKSDEIRIFSSKDKMNESPKARIWLNAKEGGGYWYHTGGTGSAEHHLIQAGEAVAIIMKASKKPVIWENPLRP